MFDAQEFVKAMQGMPQHFDEIVREEVGYRIERIWNGNHYLWRLDVYSHQWRLVGDIHRSWIAGGDGTEFVALINKPLDPTDDSDCTPVYQGRDLDAALDALWLARQAATN